MSITEYHRLILSHFETCDKLLHSRGDWLQKPDSCCTITTSKDGDFTAVLTLTLAHFHRTPARPVWCHHFKTFLSRYRISRRPSSFFQINDRKNSSTSIARRTCICVDPRMARIITILCSMCVDRHGLSGSCYSTEILCRSELQTLCE